MTNYDGPWKETLDTFCAAALELFFPAVHRGIDWQRKYETLDKEFQHIAAASELGSGIVDKLIKVWLNNGGETWLLLHIEFQAQAESGFPLRMYIYRSRVFLHYNQEVVSLAILGDDRPGWRPSEYRVERWGCELTFRFPTVKLLDWLPRAADLQTSRNPVAHMVLAHLRAMETTSAMDARRTYKFELARNLYDLGFDRETIRKLFNLIDRMMTLPPELTKAFREDLYRFEEERHMPYVSSIARLEREEGREEGEQTGWLQGSIATVLELRFGEPGKALKEELKKIKDLGRLQSLLDAAKQIASVEEMRRLID